MVYNTEITKKSSSTLKNKYDVFLNFRGKDTRLSFIDHLDRALVEKSVNTFLDDRGIQNGEKLAPELEDAIKASKVSIAVLSPNYAGSTWCLEELVLILAQRRTHQQTVIPIFFNVQPSDVRTQNNSFGEAFIMHERLMEEETDDFKKKQLAHKIQVWKEALTEVSLLRGMTSSGMRETLLIDEIVREITMVLDQLKEIELLRRSWWQTWITGPLTNLWNYVVSHPFRVVMTVAVLVGGGLFFAFGGKLWIFGVALPYVGMRIFEFMHLIMSKIPLDEWVVESMSKVPF